MKATLATVNEWNARNSFSRAHVDKRGNPVLEGELLLMGGVTRESMELFVGGFRDIVVKWARFLKDREQAPRRTHPTPGPAAVRERAGKGSNG